MAFRSEVSEFCKDFKTHRALKPIGTVNEPIIMDGYALIQIPFTGKRTYEASMTPKRVAAIKELIVKHSGGEISHGYPVESNINLSTAYQRVKPYLLVMLFKAENKK